jgi:hypothetical protein
MRALFTLNFWSSSWALFSRSQRRWGLGMLLLHFTLTLWFSWQQSPLADENDYLGYAITWAKGKPERTYIMYDSKSPAAFPALAPIVLKPFLSPGFLSRHPNFFVKAGRVGMYGYAVLAFYVLCCWLRRWLGVHRFWWLPGLLFAFDPTVFSYSMVIGTDLACASVLLAALYSFWRFSTTMQRRYWWLAAVFVGMAVVVKASMVYAYPLLLILFLVRARPAKRPRFGPALLWQLLLFALVQLALINLAYYGKGSFTPLNLYGFQSQTFQHLQQQLSFLGWFPLPVPAAFVQGIDMLQHHASLGGCMPYSTYDGVWLLGKGTCTGTFWYYYLAVGFFKMPLFVGLMALLSVAYRLRRGQFRPLLVRHSCIWLPFFWFLGILSFFNPFQIGFRHALILLPFLYLALAPSLMVFGRKWPWLLYLALACHTVGVVSYWPNSIAYTNLLVGNKKLVYKKFRDSSIDYGQNNGELKTFQKNNPQFKVPTAEPDTGLFVLSVHEIAKKDVPEAEKADWLFNNFEPYDQINYTILLFRVSAVNVEQLQTP